MSEYLKHAREQLSEWADYQNPQSLEWAMSNLLSWAESVQSWKDGQPATAGPLPPSAATRESPSDVEDWSDFRENLRHRFRLSPDLAGSIAKWVQETLSPLLPASTETPTTPSPPSTTSSAGETGPAAQGSECAHDWLRMGKHDNQSRARWAADWKIYDRPLCVNCGVLMSLVWTPAPAADPTSSTSAAPPSSASVQARGDAE